jgi:type I restriction enzyme S subunit
MSKNWDLVPLREILIKSENWIELKPTERYKQVTVRIWGKGVVERNEVTGGEISASKRLQVKSGQFIVSRIDARHGAFGLIPDSLDGAVVTNDFPVFTPNLQRILPQFLGWMSKTANFVEICKAASEGTTNRVRLKEDHFLAMDISLPPIEEQQRIVARVEELAGKIEEVRSLRQQALEETEALLGSELNLLFNRANSNQVEFKSIGTFTVYDRYGPRFYNEAYSEDGVPIMRATDVDDAGRVNYHSMPKMLVSPEDREKLTLYSGDLVVVRSGSVGRAAVFDRADLDCIPSAYMIQFRFDESVIPHYVRYCFQAPFVKDELKGRGTALKNINAQKIKSVKIPVPPIPEQRRIVAYLDNLQAKVDKMKRLREGAMKELDAMLPSILDKAFKGEL